MKTKAKKFSHKLLALFMALVMGLSCFSGVMTALGAESTRNRYDNAVEYNDLAWNILSDEQVATAILEYADEFLPALKELEPKLKAKVDSADIPVIKLNWDLNERKITVKFAASTLATFTVKLGSVDELLETLQSVDAFLSNPGAVGGLLNIVSLGVITDLNFSSIRNMKWKNADGTPAQTSSCDVLRGVLGILYNNNDTIIGNFLRGSLNFGVIKVDLYGMLGGLFGISAADAQDNFAYNVVKGLLFNKTEWFTDAEKQQYTNDKASFVYDDVLLQKMTDELLCKINVRVTYADGTTSATRRAEIAKYETGGRSYKEAVRACNAATGSKYDENLIYSSEKGHENNILLFAYGNDRIVLDKNSNIADFAYQALGVAWNTVLKDTVKMVRASYDVDRGHGSNFDNAYYNWASKNLPGGWNTENLTEMYSAANVMEWATAVYASYAAETPEEFLSWVQNNLDHERTAPEGSEGTWHDIESNKIFNKLRYSPLVDYYFANTAEYAGMKTGPINLYLAQTGTSATDAFFQNEYSNYTSMVGGFNDCLIAIVNDIFPNSQNIGVNMNVPEMKATGNFPVVDDAAVKTIANTLVGNALKLVQYVADTTDENILKAFYIKNGSTAVLRETNLESAIIPLFISCVGNVKIAGNRLDQLFHPADLDMCRDFESIAFIALREYLSYILPEYDYNNLVTIKTDGFGKQYISATLEGTILPMARDAVVYVMDGYVPVTDSSGNEWRVEDPNRNQDATLLELLNSVICYYADNYQFKAADKKDGNALGIASLLGVCDQNGKSLVNTGNTIWKNIDLIANKLIPVLGSFQGTGFKNFNSEALIWNDVVLGMLDFGGTHTSGLYGGSNFIYRVLKFITADPIQKDPIVYVAYDFVENFINGLFGPRYNGQTYIPFPSRKSEHPFDDLLQKTTLAGTGPNDVGAVQKWINNLIEFSGFGYNGVATYPDTLLPGVLFALSSVNSFFTLIPSIAEHEFKLSTTSFEKNMLTGCKPGVPQTSLITFKNASDGVNLAYVDGMNNSVEQLSRYYVKITGTEITLEGGGSTQARIDNPPTGFIAPGTSVTLGVTTYYAPQGDAENSVYTATITYDVYDGNDANATRLYTGLKSRDYQYLTGAKGWFDTVYDKANQGSDGIYPLTKENGSTDPTYQEIVGDGLMINTTGEFASAGGSRFIVSYPEAVVLSSDNLAAVNDYGIRAYFQKYSGGNKNRPILGVYYYEDKVVYDDATKAEVTVGKANPIPVFDKKSGDLLTLGKFDYTLDGVTWNNAGSTQEEMDKALEEYLKDETKSANNFKSNPHVAYTLQDAIDRGMVQAYHLNKDGEYEYIYLKYDMASNQEYKFDNIAPITMRGPVDGFYLNTGKTAALASNTGTYMRFLTYDNKTSVGATKVNAKMAICAADGVGSAEFRFIVADTSGTSGVAKKLDEIKTILNNYRDSDLKGNTITEAKKAIKDAFAANCTPLTPESAEQLSDKTSRQFVTSITSSTTGDTVYAPVKDINLIPAEMRDYVYKNATNGIYYADPDFKAAIYSTAKPVVSDFVKNKDASGIDVTAVDGVFKYKNTVNYEKDWNLRYDTPYYTDTTEQAKDADGNFLYNQIQFKHYNEHGKEVRDADNWTIAIPQTSMQITPSTDVTVDNRGLYTKANDSLDYRLAYIYQNIDTTIAQPLLENISKVRNNLESADFDVVTYNKMVALAKKAEAEFKLDISYTYEEPAKDVDGSYLYDDTGEMITETIAKTDTVSFSRYNGYMNDANIKVTGVKVTSNLSSIQVEEYVRLFNLYMSKVVNRGFFGDKIEAEILCASGNPYTELSVTTAQYDAEGNLTSPAVVKKTAGSADPARGAWAADGTLVNKGAVVYSADSWDRYVDALANAVAIAQHGNSDAYKKYASRNYYVAAEKDNYTAQITNCYNADTALQKAEIALTTAAPSDGFNVSASLVVATRQTGTTNNIPVNGDYTITVSDASGNPVVSQTFSMSKDNNTFNLTLPTGTYTATIESQFSITRDDITIVVGNGDVAGPAIPIIATDFDSDTNTTAADALEVYASTVGSSNLSCDLDGDTAITAADALIVYACAGTALLKPITIA